MCRFYLPIDVKHFIRGNTPSTPKCDQMDGKKEWEGEEKQGRGKSVRECD